MGSASGGQVSSTYVRLLYEFLQREGIDGEALLGEPAPPPDDLGLGRYPVSRWRALLEKAAEALPRPALGLEIGSLIAPHHFGVLGYVTLHCGTLGEALQRLRDFERLVYEVSPGRVEVDIDEVRLVWGQEAGRPGQLVDETAIAALVTYARDLTAQRLAPRRVEFVNPPPPDLEPYRRFFGCPVRFGRAQTVVALPLEALGLPLRRPDPHLRELLDGQAQRLLEQLPRHSDLLGALRPVLVRNLREGHPTLSAAATALHCSARTLQRRLEAEGLSFQTAVDDVRRQLAEDYLRDPRLQLTEIAALLGYADQSAFTRAFRRWTGISPLRWRKDTAGSRQPRR